MNKQVFRMGCHGCRAEEKGFASTREMAFVAIDDWQGRHKLGCCGPLWYSIGPAKVAAEETTKEDKT